MNTAIIRNGTYRIRSGLVSNPETYLELQDGGFVASVKVPSNDSKSSDAHGGLWRILSESDGVYRIICLIRDNVLGIGSGGRVAGVGSDSNHTWTIEPRGNSSVIGNATDSTAIHLTEVGRVVVWDRNNSPNQRWIFELIESGQNSIRMIPRSGNAILTPATTPPLLLLETYQQPGTPGQFSTFSLPAPHMQLDHLVIYLTAHGRMSYFITVDVYLAPATPKSNGQAHYLNHVNTDLVQNVSQFSIPILDTSKAILLGRLFQGRTETVSIEKHFDLDTTIPAGRRAHITVYSALPDLWIGARATLRTKRGPAA